MEQGLDNVRSWGLLAEFAEPEQLIAAVRRVRAEGYTQVEAYSPFSIVEVEPALGLPPTRLRYAVAAAGFAGAGLGYFMQWFALVYQYPLNIGDKPLHSWPAFLPITFEVGILFAALTAAFGMLARNGLPRVHHPLFAAPHFERATIDGFFLSIEANDPRYKMPDTRTLLESLGPRSLTLVREEFEDVAHATVAPEPRP